MGEPATAMRALAGAPSRMRLEVSREYNALYFPSRTEASMSQTLQEFLGIRWPERSSKPRKQGLTMVMDTGWPTNFVESLMDQYGEYLDVVKLWDPHLRAPAAEVRKKI